MNDIHAMGKLVPGFEFLQNMVKGAGAAMPNIGQWVTPTLDPAELDKRIGELRTVQFWLEQNANMLAATIQALQVQRMTLATLQSMNLSFGQLTEALKVKTAEAGATTETSEDAAAAPGVVDPMQWWGALTQQFTQIATKALNDSVGEISKVMPSAAAAAQPDGATEAPARGG